jgi:hypothetical protein
MRLAVVAAVYLATVVASLPAQAPPADPLATYKQYLAVLAKAKTLDELLPYYTKELADGLRKMPAEMRANYLKMNARTLTDLKVTKQTVTADKAEFEMSAKTQAGAATNGTATLLKEGGGWKVEDEAWATPRQ